MVSIPSPYGESVLNLAIPSKIPLAAHGHEAVLKPSYVFLLEQSNDVITACQRFRPGILYQTPHSTAESNPSKQPNSPSFRLLLRTGRTSMES